MQLKRQNGAGLLSKLLLLALVVGGGMLYNAKIRKPPPQAVMTEPTAGTPAPPPAPLRTPATAAPAPETPTPSFRCEGRTHCSQMTSCAEATYFLKNCPNTKMDGDHDGVPCEQQWCTGPLTK